MKNIRVFLSEIFQYLEVKFSIYLNKHVFVMFLFAFLHTRPIFKRGLPLKKIICSPMKVHPFSIIECFKSNGWPFPFQELF